MKIIGNVEYMLFKQLKILLILRNPINPVQL
jgi:hypothetical protein